MDNKEQKKKEPTSNTETAAIHPYESANFFSRAVVGWMSSILQLGSKRPLVKDDIFPVRKEDSMQVLVTKLESEWRQEIKRCFPSGCKPRLWKALARLFSWKAYTLMLMLILCRLLCITALPMLMWFFLLEFEKESQDGYSKTPFLFVTGIAILAFCQIFAKSHAASMAEIWGNQLKVSCIGLVYKKILTKLRRGDVQKIITGKTINLVTNDAQKLEPLVFSLCYILPAPLYISGSFFVLLFLIGWKALVGVGVYIVAMVYISKMSHKNGKLRLKTALATDKRLEVMNEIVSGIRTVKMYAWEWKFTETIKQLRRKEMWYIRLRGVIISSLYSMAYTVSPLAVFVSTVVLIAAGEQITAFKLFTIVTTFNVINFSVSIAMGFLLPLVTEANSAINRIEKFLSGTYTETKVTFASQRGPYGFLTLSLKDVATAVRQENVKDEKAKLVSIFSKDTILGAETKDLTLVSVSASWDRSEERMALKDISLSLSNGEMMAITGSVGSGKSSLLMAILGELPAVNGTISFSGTIAYVPQIPWIFSGTIRENILFGRPFHEATYHKILDVCCMQTDLNNFPYGDLTEIGSRGVSLSGGQRVRVSLARALYSDADLYLLDDPLSAVDFKVGKRLFQRCICGFLSGKTRVFVTHQLHYLTLVDNVTILSKGRMVLEDASIPKADANSSKFDQCDVNKPDISRDDIPDQSLEVVFSDGETQDLKEDEEDRNTGTITWRLYWNYLRTAYSTLVVLCLILVVLGMKVLLLMSYWWASQVAEMPQEQQSSSRTLGIYGGLVGSSVLANAISSYLVYWTLLEASEKLHNKMVLSVIKAPLLYFDKTPVGRILNRFSKDIGSIDDILPPKFLTSIEVNLFSISIILMPLATNVWLILIAVPLVSIAFYFVRYYLKSSREIKRLEAITCSPVYSHISETIAGLEVIRSSQMEQEFLRRLFKYQDENTSALMMVITSTQWLKVRVICLCSLMIAAAGFGAILVTQSPALAGISLAFLVESTENVDYGFRVASEVENLMTSVERVMTYTKLDAEVGYSSEIHPPDSWPKKGTIHIKDLSFRYTESWPLVLKDINLFIADKEKVGVVGRTGAGKSSLVASLLRMPDPEGKVTRLAYMLQVLIDGVDIGAINLQAARRGMAVIAQDPVLFGGSLRRNMDPFSRYTDMELWTALEEVQLKGMVEELPGQLYYQLKESGSNFSVGERQLVCLARALVHRSKIIIMDEATANVDFKTDRLIQEVIRHKFKDSTVLTIAHRLDTIMDYDKVLVLEGGRVMEFDKPDALIRNGGLFADLVKIASESKSRTL